VRVHPALEATTIGLHQASNAFLKLTISGGDVGFIAIPDVGLFGIERASRPVALAS